MRNKEIAGILQLSGKLMDLHGENAFKSRSYGNAAFRIERLETQLEEMTEEEIEKIQGIGKGIAAKITEINSTGNSEELETLIEKTPEGVLQMMEVKGIGPKKVAVIWKELGIETLVELLYACNENRLTDLKGFGKKTQELVKNAVEFTLSNLGKYHYATVEKPALQLMEDFEQTGVFSTISFCGDLRRMCEVIEKIEFLVSLKDDFNWDFLAGHPLIKPGSIGIKADLVYFATVDNIICRIYIRSEEDFFRELFIKTGNDAHLEKLKHLFPEKFTSFQHEEFASEEEIYNHFGIQFVEPEMREGMNEIELAANNQLPALLNLKDLKGILHNHTTYSDGLNSLEEMATACKEMGYEYIGICDHSKAAFYANGLDAERVKKQQAEIDLLNKKLFPFRIFKGIESDILNDGKLDFEPDVLGSFDFVVASVHSNLRMDKEKATARLLAAIQNPFTTILGHPTGRLILAREGYPIEHKTVIDACAENNVILELNAHPYRLDIDWRWIQYALEKGVKISVNPDAHMVEGLKDMYFGVCAARKGGLTAAFTFNALTRDEIAGHFLEKKTGALSKRST